MLSFIKNKGACWFYNETGDYKFQVWIFTFNVKKQLKIYLFKTVLKSVSIVYLSQVITVALIVPESSCWPDYDLLTFRAVRGMHQSSTHFQNIQDLLKNAMFMKQQITYQQSRK